MDQWPPVLHLGCGRKKEEGAFGVDIQADSAADLVLDLNATPWPFPDSTFDRVIAIDVLEHLTDLLRIMEEIHRILRPGGAVVIRVPGASSHHQVSDPTHRISFTSKSFQFFTERHDRDNFSYSRARFTIERCEYRFPFNRTWLDDCLLRWVNRRKVLYERRFLYWYQIPALEFVLRKP